MGHITFKKLSTTQQGTRCAHLGCTEMASHWAITLTPYKQQVSTCTTHKPTILR